MSENKDLAYYRKCNEKQARASSCHLCGCDRVSLYIIEEAGKPVRVNPVCPECFSEHIYDQDKNLQKVITHIGLIRTP